MILAELLSEAQKAFDEMTPEQQAEVRREQRKSFALGQLLLSRYDLTIEQAEEIVDKVLNNEQT